ncbi:MAG TPA: caspase family protein, partial [Panacibacter sp.]|nr:caspase family protein [Panacibacter sp.]
EEMKKVGELTNTMSYPAGFAFTSDGKNFISGNYDGIVRIYDFTQQTIKRELGGHANIIYNMDLSADGKSLAVQGNQGYYRDGYMQLLDMERGAIGKNNHASAMNFTSAFSPDKKYIVSGSFEGALTVMDAASLQKLSNVAENDIASSIAFSSDGKKMITTDRNNDDYQMELRSLPSGEVSKKIKLPYTAGSLLFAPDGHSVYAGIAKDDKTVKIDLQTGKIVQTFQHPGEYASVTGIRKLLLTKDGSTLITGDDYGHIRWWNVSTGKETGDLLANKGRVNSMILLPNGKQIATCGGESAFTDADIKIIDIGTRQVVKTLKGHENSPTALAATPDGKYLLSGSYDRTIKVWDLATGESLATMVFFGGTDWVMVDKSGRFDGTPDGMRQLYYTRGLDVLPLESSFEQFYTPSLLPRLLQGENFTPPSVDINTLKAAPTVKITYKGETRNLEVVDDMPAYVSSTGKVTLQLNASSTDDVISELRLYQNGKLITGGTRNLVVEDDNKTNNTKDFQVELTEGENIFKAVAINSQRTESKPDAINVTFKPEKKENNIQSAVTLHLLVVGVNTYKNPKYTLNYASADATAFKEAIENGSTGIFSKVDEIFLSDADASKEKIVAALDNIKQTAAPQDMFVFYYAGHGVINDTKEFFIVPYDVLQLYGNDDALAQKGISAEQLQQFSKDIKAQKQLFILDACQSAGALTDVASLRGAAEEKAIAQLARSTGTHWLTASGSEQFAAEFAQLGHGSFTYCILQALKGGADNGDHKITVQELDAYLQDKVPEITQKYKGTAQYPASYNYGNDFPIIIISN